MSPTPRRPAATPIRRKNGARSGEAPPRPGESAAHDGDGLAGPGADRPEGNAGAHLARRLEGEGDPHQLYESSALGDPPGIGAEGKAPPRPKRARTTPRAPKER